MEAVLLATILISADYLATEESLAAGVKAYEVQAESVRRKAVDAAGKQAAAHLSQLSSVKTGRIVPSLIGTRSSVGSADRGRWTFGTASEKAAKIASLENESEAWRGIAEGLRSRKLVPQIAMNLEHSTPGATGVFPMRSIKVLLIDDDKTCRASLPGYALFSFGGERPYIASHDPFRGIEVIIEHDRTAAISEGRIQLLGVYQLTKIVSGIPTFSIVNSLHVGSAELMFSKDGVLLPPSP